MYVVQFGKWDYRALADKPKEKRTEFWACYFEQFIRRGMKDGGEEGTVEIVDFDGFSLSHHASKDGESFDDFCASIFARTTLTDKLDSIIVDSFGLSLQQSSW